MATHRLDITPLFVSNNASVFWEPATIRFSTAPWENPILVYKEIASRVGAFAAFAVPTNYVGSPAFIVQWTTDTAVANDVEWDVDYRCVDVGESVNQAGSQEALNTEDTAPGTAGLLQEVTVGSATAGNFAADDLCQVALYRDGTDAGDTLNDEACVFKIIFQYADA
jgi:hypothetical protein